MHRHGRLTSGSYDSRPESVHLENNHLESFDYSPIKQFKNLKELNVAGNYITTITGDDGVISQAFPSAYFQCIPSFICDGLFLGGDEKTGAEIVLKAVQAPLKQIALNAGLDGAVILNEILKANKANYGFNALTNEYTDMVESGIIDPTKVTRSALENAASVAGVFLTTESVIADIKEPEPPQMPAGGMGGMY